MDETNRGERDRLPAKQSSGDVPRGSGGERGWQREARFQNQRYHSRRDRDDSPSSDDSDSEGPRFQSAVDRSRGSRNEDVQDKWKSRDGRGRRATETDRGRERDDSRREAEGFRSGDRNRMSRNEDDGQEARKPQDGRGWRTAETGRGRERGDGRDTSVPELHSIHKATVHSIKPFGLFVRIDGYRNHGLVHLSQISNHEVTKRDDSDAAKIEAISSIAGDSEQVWVKVISVKTEDDGSVKIGCSLKYVSQGDGRDLDPNNLQSEKLNSKPSWQAPEKLQLEAVYNVTCTRCGGHGHLRKECYSAGEKTYELLQDEDDNGAGAGRSDATGVVPVNLAHTGQSSRPPSGPAGRGRAMVQPAWMKHGISAGVDKENGVGHSPSDGADDRSKDKAGLPEKVTTVEEALSVIAKLKEEKRRKKEQKRERKHHRRDKKYSSKEGKRDSHRKRHHSDDDHKGRKKHRENQ